MHDRDNGPSPIQVRQLDASQLDYLREFSDQMVADGFDAWRMDRLKYHGVVYFCAYYKNKIVAINGVQKVNDEEWCPMVRQATLKSHLHLIKPTRVWGSGSIQPRFLARPSIEYCIAQGAKSLIAYLNIDGSDTNLKYGKKAERMIEMGLWEYDGPHIINDNLQEVFIMNKHNFMRFISIVERQPLVLRDGK